MLTPEFVERIPQDARGTAAARALRARDDRAAQGSRDRGELASPAVRFPEGGGPCNRATARRRRGEGAGAGRSRRAPSARHRCTGQPPGVSRAPGTGPGRRGASGVGDRRAAVPRPHRPVNAVWADDVAGGRGCRREHSGRQRRPSMPRPPTSTVPRRGAPGTGGGARRARLSRGRISGTRRGRPSRRPRSDRAGRVVAAPARARRGGRDEHASVGRRPIACRGVPAACAAAAAADGESTSVAALEARVAALERGGAAPGTQRPAPDTADVRSHTDPGPTLRRRRSSSWRKRVHRQIRGLRRRSPPRATPSSRSRRPTSPSR